MGRARVSGSDRQRLELVDGIDRVCRRVKYPTILRWETRYHNVTFIPPDRRTASVQPEDAMWTISIVTW